MNAKTTIRRYRLVILIAVLALAGFAGWFIWQENNKNGNQHLVLYGNVDIREVQLAFRQAGRIDQMHYDEGDQVQAGDLLASIDAIPLRDALAAADAAVIVAQAELDKLNQGLRPQEIIQAQENLKQAEAQAVNTSKNFNRQSKLLSSGAISQKTLDLARAQNEQAQASVKAAAAALSQALEGYRKEDIAAAHARLTLAQANAEQSATALADTNLLAPSNGTVISRIREIGSMVNSQDTVYSLSLDKPVYIRAYIAETELGRIAPGTPVTVSTDTSSKIYSGQVGFISPKAEFTPKTVETVDLRTDLVYRLRIVIDDENAIQTLRQGMPVTIDIDSSTGL